MCRLNLMKRILACTLNYSKIYILTKLHTIKHLGIKCENDQCKIIVKLIKYITTKLRIELQNSTKLYTNASLYIKLQ